MEPEIYSGYNLSFSGFMESQLHPELGEFGFVKACPRDTVSDFDGIHFQKPFLVFRILPLGSGTRDSLSVQIQMQFAMLKAFVDQINRYTGPPMTAKEWDKFLGITDGWPAPTMDDFESAGHAYD